MLRRLSCTTRSRTVGIPSGLVLPSAFGISTERAVTPEGSSPPKFPFLSAFQLRLSSRPEQFSYVSYTLWFTFVPSQVLWLLALITPSQQRAMSPLFSPPSLLPSFIGKGLITTTDSSATYRHMISPLGFLLLETTC